MADPARTTGPAPGHSLDEAHERNQGALNGQVRPEGEPSPLRRWLGAEVQREKFDRGMLKERLPAIAIKQLDLSQPRESGNPREEALRCALIKLAIYWSLDTYPNLDRAALEHHAAREDELAKLFQQLAVKQREEGRY